MSESKKRHPRRSDEEWISLIMDCRTSGMTDRAWCENQHIQPSKFYYHIRRLREKACILPDNPRVQAREAQHEIVKINPGILVPDRQPVEMSIPMEIQPSPVVSCQSPAGHTLSGDSPATPAIHLSFGGIGIDIHNSADRNTILNTLSVLQSLC